MSYLNRLRLHFSGKFQAAVSTVNNEVKHFENAKFQPAYQDRQQPGHPNGGWNPRGDASWRFIDVKVTSAFQTDGGAVSADDDILTCLIGDNDRSVAAKLVDLDPQQQMVSMIWGFEVRIVHKNGDTLMRGTYKPAPFTDIWKRVVTLKGGDAAACSMYQSVLTDVEWGDLSTSPFLQELKQASPDRLSIKFNVDGYDDKYDSPTFTRGRVVGTIGPALANEPDHFVRNGRQLTAVNQPGNQGFFIPQGQINFCTAVVDEQAGKVLLDLGNALPTYTSGDVLYPYLGKLSLVCDVAPPPPPPHQQSDYVTTIHLGDIPYNKEDDNKGDKNWYEQTAGIIELPSDRSLTKEELDKIAINPLRLLLPDSDSRPSVAISEAPDGLFIRADEFVFRLNPGDQASVRLYATQYGQPYPNERVLLIPDPLQLQPPVATPVDALEYPARVVTDENGIATFELVGHDPKNPRGYIDGQLYGVRPMLEETASPFLEYPINPSNFISVLLWDSFEPCEPPTWYGTKSKSEDGIQPIFQQYANLYPVMLRFLNMGDYHDIVKNRDLLLLAFTLDAENPNSMPVTRDLSEAKRKAIVRWLTDVGPDGKPLLGDPPAPKVFATLGATGEAVTQATGETPAIPASLTDRRGGKEAAMHRRLLNSKRGHIHH